MKASLTLASPTMKGSIKFRDDQHPLSRAKISISILGIPFLSSISASDAKELHLDLATSFKSGTSLCLSSAVLESQSAGTNSRSDPPPFAGSHGPRLPGPGLHGDGFLSTLILSFDSTGHDDDNEAADGTPQFLRFNNVFPKLSVAHLRSMATPPPHSPPVPTQLMMSSTPSDPVGVDPSAAAASVDGGAPQPKPGYKRRKIVIFLAYYDTGYRSMQKNFGTRTIQGDLKEVLFLTGVILAADLESSIKESESPKSNGECGMRGTEGSFGVTASASVVVDEQ